MISAEYSISGMTCQHCISAVTQELSALDGVRDVGVDLVPNGVSIVTVTSTAPLDPAAVAAAVDEAGYQLSGV